MAAPKRELFKAADVCEVVQVQPYVLRSWEAEFPQIGRQPDGGGPRLYRRSDVDLVLKIKQLVFEEGLTLSGARRRLEEEDGESETTGSVAELMEEVLDDRVRERVKTVRTGLQSLLQMLSRDEGSVAELRLVSPPAVKRSRKSKA